MFKKSGLLLLLGITSLVLVACAAPMQELSVHIKKSRTNKAYDIANRTGVGIGYDLEINDFVNKRSRLRMLDMNDLAPSEFIINIEIDKEEEPYKLKMLGRDAGENRDEEAVGFHMNKIADDVRECCGVPVEEE